MMPARLLALFRASGAAFATAGALALSMLAAPPPTPRRCTAPSPPMKPRPSCIGSCRKPRPAKPSKARWPNAKAGAKGCKSVTAFSDSCVALARNSRNDLFWGNSVSAEIAAKKAIRTCTNDSADGNANWPPCRCAPARL